MDRKLDCLSIPMMLKALKMSAHRNLLHTSLDNYTLENWPFYKVRSPIGIIANRIMLHLNIWFHISMNYTPST